MTQVKISTNNSESDWSYWLQEKSSAALKYLAYAFELLNDRPTLDANAVLDLREELSAAAAYLVTVVSFSSGQMDGGRIASEVANAISRNGKDGYEAYLHQIGMLPETSRMVAARQVCEVLHPILQLLTGPRGENRTLIHEHLLKYRGGSKAVEAVRELTEAVTDGQLQWMEYGTRCRAIIMRHDCVVKDEGSSPD